MRTRRRARRTMYSKLSQTTISRAQACHDVDRPPDARRGRAREWRTRWTFTTADIKFQRCSMSSWRADVVIDRNNSATGRRVLDASTRTPLRSGGASRTPRRARPTTGGSPRPSEPARAMSKRKGDRPRERAREVPVRPSRRAPLRTTRAPRRSLDSGARARPALSPRRPPRHPRRVAQEGAEAEREDLHRRLEGPREMLDARSKAPRKSAARSLAEAEAKERAARPDSSIARRVASRRPSPSRVASPRGSTARLLRRPRRAPVPDPPPFSRPPFPSCPSPSFFSAASASASRTAPGGPDADRRRRWRRTC